MVKTIRLVAVLALLWRAPLASAQTPSDAELTFQTGITHLREGRSELALEEFKKAIKGDAKNPYFHKGLGQAYLVLRKYGEAEAAFRKALELNPYYADIHNDLGTTLIAQGKREEGKKEYLTAFNDPTNPTPELTARNLASAYQDEKNYQEALNWYRSSINRNKYYPDAHLGLADTLMSLGRLEEAVLQLEEASKVLPDDMSLMLGLGQAYYRAGRFSDARSRLEQVARKDPAGPAGRRAVDLLKNFPR
jgi:Flp pilus assembly protein TadD